MNFSLLLFGNNKTKFKRGIRIVTYATAVRWIGWGSVDPLIPVFLFSFSHSYASSAFLNLAYEIAFLLTLPIVGIAADRLRAEMLVLAGLLLYPIVGFGYFFASITGFILILVVARIVNGILFAIDTVGRETYIRRHTPRKHASLAFGYFDAVANFWWMTAAVTGAILVRFFNIRFLFLGIVPTSVIAYFIMRDGLTRNKLEHDVDPVTSRYSQARKQLNGIVEFANWNWDLSLLALTNSFLSFASAVLLFIIPIYVYKTGGDLGKVLLIGGALAVPSVLGFRLARIADRFPNSAVSYGIAVLALLLCLFSFVNAYPLQLIVSFLIGLVIEYGTLSNRGAITLVSRPGHLGRVSGLMDISAEAGSLLGPLVIGILMDYSGAADAFRIMAFGFFVLAAVLFVRRLPPPKAGHASRVPKIMGQSSSSTKII